jgi:hypothetical protein
MSTGLYSGVSGLALGTGLYKGTQGLWGGASGLINQFGATLNLDFLAGAPLDSRITFTRSTTATFVGSDGLLQSSAINAPRFDYNPATLAPRGLLIEEQRVNLLLYSEEFDNAAWLKTNTTVTANATTSPDGTTNADKLIGTTTAAGHQCQQTAVAAATLGTTYTFSVYIKAAEYGFAFVGLNGTAFVTVPYISVNLSTGAVATTNGSPVSSSAVLVGNSWLRVTITGTTDVAASTVSPDIRPSPDGVWANRNTAQDGVSGIFIWGAQLEAGSFATSYIPTVASTVTRAADVAVMTGTNFSDWYNASEGTIVVNGDSFRGTAGSARNFQFDDGTSANNIRSGGASTLQVVDANVVQANLGPTPLIPFDGTAYKFASAYKLNDFASVTTGAVATDTSGTVPTVNQLTLGSGGLISPTTFLNGHIRSITYYPQRLANAQLQALSV